MKGQAKNYFHLRAKIFEGGEPDRHHTQGYGRLVQPTIVKSPFLIVFSYEKNIRITFNLEKLILF